jgi:hypothetical protein
MGYGSQSFEDGQSMFRSANQARDQGHTDDAINLYRIARDIFAKCKDQHAEAAKSWELVIQELQRLGG